MDFTTFSETVLSDGQCKDMILSNDYADFITEFAGNLESLKENFRATCIQVIGKRFAAAYVPRNRVVPLNISTFGYYTIPKLYGLLDTSSMEETGINRLRRQPYIDLTGRDILFGIVDTGIDYTHPAFKNADNTTRIFSIWDQSIQSGNPPEGFLYGTEYDSGQINEALASENPLEIVPSTDEEGHGTFLTGIAAGSIDTDGDFTGAAPQAQIVAVKLKQAKQYLKEFYLIKEDAICYQENDIMEAVSYLGLVSEKLEKPIVILIGLGTNMGSHDGSSNLDRYLDLIGDTVGVAVVTAAGNEANRGHHYNGIDEAGREYEDVEINVGENVRGFTLELWARTPNLYSVAFISPGGELISKIPARIGQSSTINFLLEPTQIYVDYYVIEPRSGNELIFMRFDRPVQGIWTIRVYSESNFIGDYNIWLPMEKFIPDNTFFVRPDPYITLCTPGTTQTPITVAAYNHVTGSLYINSSKGFTSSGRIKPDLAAPGVDVYGPLPQGRYGRRSGTSVAAAHVAGGALLMMEWGFAQRNDPNIDTTSLKQFFIIGAVRGDMQYPNRDWGDNGIIVSS